MITPVYETRRAKMPVWNAQSLLEYQVETGRVRIGPDAAREIARRIERGHGFWDISRLENAT